MAKEWTMPFLPAKNGNKLLASYNATGLAVADDNISVYLGDNVPLYPQNTITTGWRWLFDGVMSRNLLDGPPWAGAVLYSGSNWQIMTANDRRTESLLATLTADDIIIGIGLNVTATGDTVMVYDAFKVLIEYAMETDLKFS